MRPKSLYLLLTVLGAAVPYASFMPWLLEHGLDLPLFFHQMHANRVSAFFAADVFVSAVVVVVWLVHERRLSGPRKWLPLLGLMFFGVSVALPLLLFLREEARRPSSA